MPSCRATKFVVDPTVPSSPCFRRNRSASRTNSPRASASAAFRCSMESADCRSALSCLASRFATSRHALLREIRCAADGRAVVAVSSSAAIEIRIVFIPSLLFGFRRQSSVFPHRPISLCESYEVVPKTTSDHFGTRLATSPYGGERIWRRTRSWGNSVVRRSA